MTHVKPWVPALAILACMKRRYALVVMAASAGGVPAFQKVLGALPPDFEALPSANFLPDPLKFHDGRAVRMPADWAARRAEIKELLQKHVIGRLPPKAKLDRVVPVSESKGDGYSTRVVRLEYGPESRFSSQVTVTLPGGSALRGTAIDVDMDGCLVVRAANGEHRLAAGDVHHVRKR